MIDLQVRLACVCLFVPCFYDGSMFNGMWLVNWLINDGLMVG